LTPTRLHIVIKEVKNMIQRKPTHRGEVLLEDVIAFKYINLGSSKGSRC